MLDAKFNPVSEEDRQARHQLDAIFWNRKIRIALFCLVFCLMLLLVVFFHVPSVHWTIALASWAQNSGSRGIVVFALLDAIFVAAMMPGILFIMLAGAIWGVWAGSAIALVGTWLGAMISFLLGRYVFFGCGSFVMSLPYADKVDAVLKESGWKFSLLLRLAPMLPYNVLNYTLSMTCLSLGTYAWTTFVGMIPNAIAISFMGHAAGSISAAVEHHSGDWNRYQVLAILVGGSVTTVLFYIIHRLLKHELNKRLMRQALL